MGSNQRRTRMVNKMDEREKELLFDKAKVIIDTVLSDMTTDTLERDKILKAIDVAVGELRYDKTRIPNIKTEEIKTLVKKKKDNQKVIDLLWTESHSIDKLIETAIRQYLLDSKILGTFKWELDVGHSGQSVSLSTSDVDFETDMFNEVTGGTKNSYDYHWSKEIYMFPDGREISMYGDDGDYSISITGRDITTEEFKKAFEELGIEFGTATLKSSLTIRQEKIDGLKGFVEDWL